MTIKKPEVKQLKKEDKIFIIHSLNDNEVNIPHDKYVYNGVSYNPRKYNILELTVKDVRQSDVDCIDDKYNPGTIFTLSYKDIFYFDRDNATIKLFQKDRGDEDSTKEEFKGFEDLFGEPFTSFFNKYKENPAAFFRDSEDEKKWEELKNSKSKEEFDSFVTNYEDLLKGEWKKSADKKGEERYKDTLEEFSKYFKSNGDELRESIKYLYDVLDKFTTKE